MIMALLLNACGYHLRGAFELPTGLKSIYLDGGSAQLQEQFKKAMELSSVPLASSADKAGIVIRIAKEAEELLIRNEMYLQAVRTMISRAKVAFETSSK